MKLNVKQVGIGDLGMRYPMTLNILYGLERCYTPSVDGNGDGYAWGKCIRLLKKGAVVIMKTGV